MITGLELDGHDIGSCINCWRAKMTQTPFKNKWKIPERNFQMVHSDTFGPFEVSANGNRYMLVITDIKTTFVWPFPMKRKSDAAAIIEEWIKMVKVHHKSNVEIWHDDEGGEFMAKDFRKMLKKLAIVRTVTDTATPEMNPFAERAGRTLVEMTRAMLFSAGFLSGCGWKHLYGLPPSKTCDPRED